MWYRRTFIIATTVIVIFIDVIRIGIDTIVIKEE